LSGFFIVLGNNLMELIGAGTIAYVAWALSAWRTNRRWRRATDEEVREWRIKNNPVERYK
jgi:hypothetical protein